MDQGFTYDPEDLEKLLQEKSFSQLLPEEKAFVLQFVENDLEYDSMRDTYDALGTLPELEPSIIPKESSKNALMAAFESKKAIPLEEEEETSKIGFWVWFWDTNKALFSRPAFQLASLALIVTSGFYVATFSPADRTAQVAEKKTEIDSIEKNLIEKEEIKDTKEKTENKVSVAIEDSNSNNASSELKSLQIDRDNSELARELEMDNETLVNDDAGLYVAEDVTMEKSTNELFFNGSTIDVTATDNSSIDELKATTSETAKFANGLADDASMEPATNVIYNDSEADISITEYDSRTLIGNSSVPAIQLESIEKQRGKNKKSIALKDQANDLESQSSIKVANFSNLLSQLYTAE